MCHIHASRPTSGWAFFKRRLARVGPAYWIVTLATSAAILLVPALFRTSTVDLPLFLASMAFLAWPHPMLGEAMPVFLIGWTLNYEFFFYTLFALSIFILPARPWLGVIWVFALCWVAGLVFEPDQPVARFYLHPLTAEFAAGMLIWLAFRKGVLRSPILGVMCILIGMASLIWVNFHIPVGRLDSARIVYWGLPAFFLVIGAVCMDAAGKTPQSPLWRLLGDASYAIYLIHYLVLGLVRFLWGQFALKNLFSDILLILFAVGLSLVASIGFYLLIEKPASARLRHMLE
jgi:exopolysaccharide production protein ExoZ